MNIKLSTKNYRTLAVIGALLTLQTLKVSAEEVYVLSWHGTRYSTSSSGRISITSFTSQDIIRKLINDNGFTDVTQFALVYRVNKRDTAVIRLSDSLTVNTFTPVDFLQTEVSYTDVSNQYNTGTVRQAFINNEDSGTVGSLVGFENTTWSGQTRTAYSYFGSFQYSMQGNPKWADGVYYGYFSVGRKIITHN